MKYQDRDSGKEIDLNIIIGCTYWENSSGELYVTDKTSTQCWQVRPSMALKHVLLRQGMAQDAANEENVVRVVCCKPIDPGPFKGHTGNYLKNYKIGG